MPRLSTLNCLGKDKMAVLFVCSSKKDEALEDMGRADLEGGVFIISEPRERRVERRTEETPGSTSLFVEEGRGGM